MIFEFYLLIFIEGCNFLRLLFNFNIQLENIAFITTLRIRFFFFLVVNQRICWFLMCSSACFLMRSSACMSNESSDIKVEHLPQSFDHLICEP